jgi:hypothetical protein
MERLVSGMSKFVGAGSVYGVNNRSLPLRNDFHCRATTDAGYQPLTGTRLGREESDHEDEEVLRLKQT